MDKIGERIRIRLEELHTTQAELARITGLSPQRLGNYIQGRRPPDIFALGAIARALRTSTDWLLGLSESHPIEAKAVFLRLLQLDGMPESRAEAISEAASRALQLLSSLPDDADDQTRVHVAAQAAWQLRALPKPN